MIGIFAVAAILAPALPGPAAVTPDFSWALDEELVERARAARGEAQRLTTAAEEAERRRSDSDVRRKSLVDEAATIRGSMAGLSGRKKTEAEEHAAQLTSEAMAAEPAIAQFAAEAASDRSQAASTLAFAALMEREDALRKAEAADRIAPDAELGSFPDDRLKKAEAYWRKRAARAPKQIAAIDAQIDRSPTQDVRAALSARAERVRAERQLASAQIDRIAEEVRFRSETKADESTQAAAIVDEAKAKSSATQAEAAAMGMTTARSAALDRKLEQLADEREQEAWAAEQSRMNQRFWVRVGGGIAAFVIASMLIVVVVRRST